MFELYLYGLAVQLFFFIYFASIIGADEELFLVATSRLKPNYGVITVLTLLAYPVVLPFKLVRNFIKFQRNLEKHNIH